MHLLAIALNLHTFSDNSCTCRHETHQAFHFNHADHATGGRLAALQEAKCRDFYPQLPGGIKNRRPVGNFDLAIIYSQFRHCHSIFTASAGQTVLHVPQRMHHGMKEGTITYARRLTEAGYQTAYLGKWHADWLKNPGKDSRLGDA